MRRVIVIASLVVAARAAASPAMASCVPATPEQHYRRADAIFTGVARDGAVGPGGILLRPVTFDVELYLKGRVPIARAWTRGRSVSRTGRSR